MTKALFLFCISLILTSCATILTGSQRQIQVDSYPSGARVEVNGMDYGRTPATIQLKGSSSSPIITIKADGYESRTIIPVSSFNVVSILNLGNFLGWGIDFASGALWVYDPKYYSVELRKIESQNIK